MTILTEIARSPSFLARGAIAVSSSPTEVLWIEYREDPSPERRNALAETYTALVRFVAAKVHLTLAEGVDQGDLVSYAWLGLMEAIERFEDNQGVRFETYAVIRCRGSILDGLRQADWVPRSVRRRARQYQAAIDRLAVGLGRTPTVHEIAADLDEPIERVLDTQRAISAITVSLYQPNHDAADEDDSLVGDLIVDRQAYDIDHQVRFQILRDMVAQGIGDLKLPHQIVLGLYYLQGLTLAQIGAEVGLTESRICQIFTAAMRSLETNFANRR